MSEQKLLLHFSRGQVLAEKQYYAEDPLIAQLILDIRRTLPIFGELDRAFVFEFGDTLSGALSKPPTGNPYYDRTVQLYLYALIGFAAERCAASRIEAVGFYSAGCISAALYSGLFSVQCLREQLRPFFYSFFDATEATKRDNDWRDVIVRSPCDLEESVTFRDVAACGVPRVYLKDRRAARTALVSGEYGALGAALQAIDDEIGLLDKPNLATPKVGAAHTPELRDAKYRDMLEGIVLSPPRLPVISGDGCMIGRSGASPAELRDFVYDAISGTLDTRLACSRALDAADRILVVGSQRALKTFDGVDRGACPPVEILTTKYLIGYRQTAEQARNAAGESACREN